MGDLGLAQRRAENAREGRSCCDWATFVESYALARKRWFDFPITPDTLAAADRAWRSGNTGYEAAHTEQQRARRAAVRPAPANAIAFDPPVEPDLLTVALINEIRYGAAPGTSKDKP